MLDRRNYVQLQLEVSKFRNGGSKMDDQYLTPPETAELVRRPTSTLAYWRHRDEGPPYAKIGRRVVYRRSDVLAWMEAQFAQAAS